MRKSMKSISILAALFMFAAFFAIGCRPKPAQRPVPKTDRYGGRVADMYDRDMTDTRYDDMDYYVMPNTRGYMANKGTNVTLERKIEDLKGVDDAIVLLDNQTCYVGVSINKAETDETEKQIKTKVTNKVKDEMQYIRRCYVTTNMDRVEKLRQYKGRIINGKTIRDYIDDIRDLF